MDWSLLIFAAILGFAGLGIAGIYNNLVKLRNRYRNAFSQIDVQLKRRHDLIPNLVETARSYMKHERETLEAVIRARNIAESARQEAAAEPGNTSAMTSLMNAESSLGGFLGRLLAVSESYPDLKANQTMKQLTEELTSTENRVAFARQSYNDNATKYNTVVETFPAILVASFFQFGTATLYELQDHSEREPVEVSFAA